MSFRVKFNNQESKVEPSSQLQVIDAQVTNSSTGPKLLLPGAFDQSDQSETSTKNLHLKIKGPFAILFSTIVLSSVAIGTLGALVFFYFQTLQPVILDQLAAKNLNQLTLISDTYSQQTQKYFTVPTNLYSDLNSDPSLICNLTGEYDQSQNQTDKLTQLSNVELQPKLDLAQKFEAYNFYSSGFEKILDQSYTTYQQSLTIFRESAMGLRVWPKFMVYRSQWFKACQALQPKTFVLSQNCLLSSNSKDCVSQKQQEYNTVKTTCDQLISVADNFNTSIPNELNWINDFVGLTNQSLKSCRQLAGFSNTFDSTNWRIQWTDGYEDVLNFRPDLGIDANLLNAATDNLATSIRNSKAQINTVLDTKADTNSRWYVLERRS